MFRFTCRAFAPDMVKRNKGHIVEIASMSSFVGVGVFADYSACKTALISLTESELIFFVQIQPHSAPSLSSLAMVTLFPSIGC
jgi:hypothetical protein